MRSQTILLGLGLALLAPPAQGAVTSWLAVGTVDAVSGTTSLLPLPAAPGDSFELAFSIDDAAVDLNPAPDRGAYLIPFLRVTIAGNSLDWIGPGVGMGGILIQANAVEENQWGVSACLGSCDPDYDEARLNFFFPSNTIGSEALTPPPGASGATVQFGLFSLTSGTSDEAQVAVAFESVPEPAAPLSLGAGIVALGTARLARAARRRRAGAGVDRGT